MRGAQLPRMIPSEISDRELLSQFVGREHGRHAHPRLADLFKADDREGPGLPPELALKEPFGSPEMAPCSLSRHLRKITERFGVWDRAVCAHASQIRSTASPLANGFAGLDDM